MLRRTSCLILLAFAAVAPIFSETSAQNATPVAPDYKNNPKFIAATREAQDCLAHRQFVFAEDAYRKAIKLSGGQDAPTLEGLYQLQNRLGRFKDAAATAGQLEAIATTPLARSEAQTQRGVAAYS